MLLVSSVVVHGEWSQSVCIEFGSNTGTRNLVQDEDYEAFRCCECCRPAVAHLTVMHQTWRCILPAGWQLESETRGQPGERLAHGRWEVAACLDDDFVREMELQVSDEREREVVLALRDACGASLECVEGGRKGVRAMDVWVAGFV